MPSPSTDVMDTSSQYSSCETLDSHRSSETDERNEVNGNGRLNRKISVEHVDYIQKERITRAAPPKPAYNPMQFVQIKPSNLFQTAQEQLKQAEEIRKIKEINRKEEPEEWQNNLDNWKSSRRKRVEHIIDRVVETKKLEEEEYDRNRRKSKTFSELMEERGSRRKLSALAIYTEEDSSIDMSDLLTASTDVDGASDKSCRTSDNHTDVDNKQPNDVQHDKKATADDALNNNNFHSTALIKDVIHKHPTTAAANQEVKMSTKTEVTDAMTADLTSNLYTMSVSAKTTKTIRSAFGGINDERERDSYEDAIEDYKSRVSKTTKLDLPKVDILKRRELFEKDQQQQEAIKLNYSKLDTEIISIKDRISSLRNNLSTSSIPAAAPKKLELPTNTKLKDRLSSLNSVSSTTIDEPSKRTIEAQFKNVQEVKNEFECKQQQMEQNQNHLNVKSTAVSGNIVADDNESLVSDREDSGIHTTDVSCAVSQSDDIQQMDEFQQVIDERFTKITAAKSEIPVAKEPQQNIADEHHKEVETDEHHHDDESSVSCSSDDQVQSVMVVNDGTTNAIMNEKVIEEALDMAFELIDNENVEPMPNQQMDSVGQPNGISCNVNDNNKQLEPIYQNVDDESKYLADERKVAEEPHYQVPRSREPYYETPKKQIPIPLYENVELMFPASSDSSRFSMAESNESFGIDDGTEMIFPIDQSKYLIMEPPKEKPPPPPEELNQEDNFKRINSTKRIKKEIRNKRSSFLGIEGQEIDDYSLELSVAPPPDMAALLQEEKRLEKQLYQKVGLYENSDNGESRDSGLSDNHSRQSSEPSSTSSDDQTMGEMSSDGMLLSEQRGDFTSYTVNDDSRMKSLEDQIRKQENYSNYRHLHDDSYSYDDDQEVLRVERELLQIEQQELKRQRENLIMRKNLARRELDEGVKMLMTNTNPTNRLSLQELNVSTTVTNGNGHYENLLPYLHQPPTPSTQIHQHPINDYRKSMPNLQEFGAGYHQNGNGIYPPAPSVPIGYQFTSDLTSSSKSEMHLNQTNLVPKPYQPPPQTTHHHNHNNNGSSSNMTRHALMKISAVPKPKLTNDWIQYRKSEPVKQSINSHWLIHEAEQRRIEQMNNVRPNGNVVNNTNKKPLPDPIIQALTQRVQNVGLGMNVNKRYTVFDSKQMPPPPQPPSHAPLLMLSQQQPSVVPSGMMHNPLSMQSSASTVPMLPTSQHMDMLSVSSKKLCSSCNIELGSGAAMIIENLALFYHIDCFKCTVCQTPIADGNIHGTDVRVRNNRLHCHNCFSNEDGIKFSCV